VEQYGGTVVVQQIEWKGHGASRMTALESVHSNFVFFSVDDALPMGRGFFRTLIDAIENTSEQWDAVVARQVPWPDADLVTKARLRKWTPAGTQVVETAQVDNVGALYRTAFLRENPFPTVPIAEDAWWSQGKRIGYVPMAPVVHSHPRHALALFRRNRNIHGELIRMGNPATVPSDIAFLKSLPTVVRPLLEGEVKEVANQLGELLGQWRAVRFTKKNKRLN